MGQNGGQNAWKTHVLASPRVVPNHWGLDPFRTTQFGPVSGPAAAQVHPRTPVDGPLLSLRCFPCFVGGKRKSDAEAVHFAVNTTGNLLLTLDGLGQEYGGVGFSPGTPMAHGTDCCLPPDGGYAPQRRRAGPPGPGARYARPEAGDPARKNGSSLRGRL